MKWFKHDSNAHNDAKIQKLIIKYGAQGYGIYWYCLEMIARNVDTHNLNFELEHDAELIAHEFNLNYELVQDMMTYMVKLGLFEMGAGGIITCLKLAQRTDEYTQQIMRKNKDLIKKSLETPDSVPIKSEVLDKNRLDKNRLDKNIINNILDDFDKFWKAYPKKVGKPKALESWKKKKPNIDEVLKTLQWQLLSKQWRDGFIPNPLTYINQERWSDEPEKSLYINPFKFEE